MKQGEFREDNFQKAMSLMKDGEGAKDKIGRRGGTKGLKMLVIWCVCLSVSVYCFCILCLHVYWMMVSQLLLYL